MVAAFRLGRPPLRFEDMEQHPRTGKYWYAGRWRTREGIESRREHNRENQDRYRQPKR